MSRMSAATYDAVFRHPGFVELSHWPDLMRGPWAVGLRLGHDHRITWVHGDTRESVFSKALRAIELLGVQEAA